MVTVDKILLIAGILLVVLGSLSMVLYGVRIYYDTEYVSIPFYDFKYNPPGNYTKTYYEDVKLCSISNLSIDKNILDEIDCLDTSTLKEMLKDYIQCSFSKDFRVRVIAQSVNDKPFRLRIILEGCRNSSCTQLMDLTLNSKPGTGVIEGEYAVTIVSTPNTTQETREPIIDYDFFKAYIESNETTIVRELQISIPAMCSKLQEINYPVLEVYETTEHHTITYIRRIDFTGLITGFILNMAGLTLMILGVYLMNKRIT